MAEQTQREKLDFSKLGEPYESFIHPIISSSTLICENFSGSIYLYYEPKRCMTSNVPSKPLEVIELKSSEVDEIFERRQSFIKILKEKGMKEQDAEKMYKALLEYVENRLQEKQLKLTDDVKEALVNMMILVAKKLDEVA
jgi:hypothetical protein